MKQCPFCAEDIQDAAIVCKHCGREVTHTTPQLIEQTEKRWKKLHLIACGAVLAGLTITHFAESSTGVGIGVLLTLGGVVSYVVASIGAYWTTG